MCQKARKFIPVLSVLLALASGCSEDAADADVLVEPAWVAPYFGEVDFLVSEPGRGDTLIIDFTGVMRVDAEGKQLFRLEWEDSTRVGKAVFTSTGSTLVLGSCFAPNQIGGDTICETVTTATRTPFIVELDRAGQSLRSTVLQPEGINALNAQALAVGADSRVHVAGTFNGTANFGDGELEAGNNQSIFYLQLDAQWQTQRSRDFGATSSFVSSVTVDENTGDVFMLGTFSGNVSFTGINLTNGPSGQAIFLARLSPDAEARWAKHFLGSGSFDTRFDVDGGLYIYGRGAAPFTSFGGDRVIDGAFATKLDSSGEHQWTWRSNAPAGTATVDSEGRIVALYTDQQLLAEEVVPNEDCFTNNYDPWELGCEYEPAQYNNHRVLRVLSPDGTVLGGKSLGSFEEEWNQGQVAVGSAASIVVAQRQYNGQQVDFGTGVVAGETALAKLRLVPKP